MFETAASSGVQRFWNQLPKRVLQLNTNKHHHHNNQNQSNKNSKGFELHADEHKLWLETWKAAACGAPGPIKSLPMAYLLLPATAHISPPPTVALQVLIRVVKAINADNRGQDFPTVNVLEAVLDTINLRLGNLVQNCSEQTAETLQRTTNELEISLFSTITNSLTLYPHDAERIARLILRRPEINEFKKKILTGQQLVDHVGQITHKHAWLGWQYSPTLDWLTSGAWHQIDGGLKATYTSAEEYAESLLKIWTLLTFYWGSGAVWPRCAHKQGDMGGGAGAEANACGEPMLAVPTNSAVCRYRNCGGGAAWKCFRHNHDAICKKCLWRQQDNLIGSPGPHASTDIYDAVIEREVVRREEAVYLLKNVESRKPPKIEPNWKTSGI